MMRLFCDGVEVAAVDIADTFGSKLKGMLGRRSAGSPMMLRRTNSVHSIGMRFPVEVAFVASDGRVIELQKLPPNRVLKPRHAARHVLEAKPGSFAKWGLKRNSRIEIH